MPRFLLASVFLAQGSRPAELRSPTRPKAVIWFVDLRRESFEEAQGGVGFGAVVVENGAQLGAFQGATGAGGVAIGDGGLVGWRQETGAGEQGEGVFFQGADPEVLGFSGVLIEVAAVSFEAFGEAERQPVGSFVEGAGMLFGIVETFRQKRLEAVPGFELAAEGAQGKGKALAGEVGAAGAVDDVEAP